MFKRKNKIVRSYRINPIIYEEMKKILENLTISETSFVEIALIEKIDRMKLKK